MNSKEEKMILSYIFWEPTRQSEEKITYTGFFTVIGYGDNR